MSAQLLTKSLFKSAIECPTKLYYAARPEYANKRSIDPFLKALAEGGHQVGALAKLYFPEGHEVKSWSNDEAVAETQKLLQQNQVTIFEAAIRHNNLFVRVDILIKNGNHFDLIEVKAKSYDPKTTQLITKKGGINAKWKPYIIDVAYQTHVLQKAYPLVSVASFLMLANKQAVAPTNGLNQKFRIVRIDDQHTSIELSKDLSTADLSTKLLITVPVNDAVKTILETGIYQNGNFSSEIDFLSTQHLHGKKIQTTIGSKCKKCEFKCTSEDDIQGKKSGFKECWEQALGWNEADFLERNILEIWNLRKLDNWLAKGWTKISDISKGYINPSPSDKKGLSTTERQWLQIMKVQNNDTTPYLNILGLEKEMQQWIFPLHFIDFETTSSPLPFLKEQHPYDIIAFQFSHHTIDADGTVTHAGQYLNVNQGEFPNYDFIRNLRNNLSQDNGTVFQYSSYENTILTTIYRQLQGDANAPQDKDDLCAFIKTITNSPKKCKEKWRGTRCMVDLQKLVKDYYYDPATHGSNSIKDVLPAMLDSSAFLQDKYSKPIYGSDQGIKSLNFPPIAWIEVRDGKVINPYDKLPKLFDGIDREKLDLLTNNDELKEGGAATTAYCRMQFSEMKDYERKELSDALLKYCELDTLAMVMLYEGWRAMLNKR